MTKTYTGKEFAPVFYRAMAAWHEGGCVGVDPHYEWEYTCSGDSNWRLNKKADAAPSCFCGSYRWKPKPKKTVTIGYQNKSGLWIEKTLAAPETVEPKKYSTYYLLTLSGVATQTYDDTSIDQEWWSNGRIFLAHEDAQAMADWLTVCCNGGKV
jgi:hypothetical protein